MKTFRSFLKEFTVTDLLPSISAKGLEQFNKREAKLGPEISHLKFNHSQFFDKLGLILTFTTKPTGDVGECYDIGSGKFYHDNVYTMKVLFPKFVDKQSFTNDLKPNFVMKEDIKFTCNCRGFHWQGQNYHASELDSSITATDIPDNYWKFVHNKDGAICKHLHGLFKNISSYQSRIFNSCKKAQLAK